MNSRISAMLLALTVLGAVMDVNAAKAELDKIEVTLSLDENDTGDDSLTMDVGQDFFVHVNLRGPDKDQEDSDIDITITVDDVLVYDDSVNVDFEEDEDQALTVSSTDFDENDAWDDDLLAYDCGRNTIEVAVSGDIKSKVLDEARLTIEGEKLDVDMEPGNPTPSDDILITVQDDDDDDVKGATVRFTNLGTDAAWDSDDDTSEEKTDSDGEAEIVLADEFKTDVNGKYQLDVWEKNGQYCKYTTTIDARQSLNISKSEPAEPAVGQNLKVRVTDQSGNGVQGAKVAVNRAGSVTSYVTDSQGYVSFQITSAGAYDLVASKSGYTESEIRHIAVSEKNSMTVELTPNDPDVGKDLEIKLTGSDGNAVKGAKINVTKPDRSSETISVPDTGKVTYRPPAAGNYSIRVEALSYQSATKDFKAFSSFKVSVSGNLTPSADIVVQVSDGEGRPVAGAGIGIRETGQTGSTDAGGKYTLSLSEPKKYTLQVRKDGFRDFDQTLDVKGTLKIILEETEINLGGTVSFQVTDASGSPASADIELTLPDGGKEKLSAGNYTPSQAGPHELAASKTGYATATASFIVKALPLAVKSEIKDGKITVTATSDGKPVADVLVSFELGLFRDEVMTGTDGKAGIAIKNLSGNMTITAEAKNYESATTLQEVRPVAAGNPSTLVMILVVLVVLVIAILVYATRGGKKKKPGLDKGGKSHLGG